MKQVLLDTGPLVAFLDRRDHHHAWAVAQWEQVAPPLWTCEAVVAEACFLVRHLPGGRARVMALLERGVVHLPFTLMDELPAVAALIARYDDVPMALADACLVRMAERHPQRPLMTLDGDFRIYRRHGRLALKLLMPGPPP